MKVIITDPAKGHLKDLFDFNSLYIPPQKNKEFLSKIIKKVRSLATLNNRGSIEENLIDADFEYRYVLQDNCKIIYRIQDEFVLVTDFFDVRQDPTKLTSRQS
mgnify:CR=1 FL=1